jgi:hypothetical protein
MKVSKLTWFVNSQEDWSYLSNAVKRGDYKDLIEVDLQGTAWSGELKIMDAAHKTFGMLHTLCPQLKRLNVSCDVLGGEWDMEAVGGVGIMENLTDLTITLNTIENSQWGSDEDEDDDEWTSEYIVPSNIAKLVKLEYLTIKSLSRYNYPRNDVIAFDDDAFANLTQLRMLRMRGFGYVGATWLGKVDPVPLLDLDGAEVETA